MYIALNYTTKQPLFQYNLPKYKYLYRFPRYLSVLYFIRINIAEIIFHKINLLKAEAFSRQIIKLCFFAGEIKGYLI